MNEQKYWNDLIGKSASRFFLLASLAREPMHGYELSKAIARACNNCCTPTDAMIYPALNEMASSGLVHCREEKQGRRTRKICELTPAGWRAFRSAALAWQRALPALAVAVAMGLEPPKEKNIDEEAVSEDDPACCS
jgi:DNA-binding PadR family transcriptional regulator